MQLILPAPANLNRAPIYVMPVDAQDASVARTRTRTQTGKKEGAK